MKAMVPAMFPLHQSSDKVLWYKSTCDLWSG